MPPPFVERLRVVLGGAVQGVGFRPFVYRLANELSLAGWVSNSSQGVLLEVEGPHQQLEEFLIRLEQEKPPRASIQSLEPHWLDATGYQGFEIRPSDTQGRRTALVLPDIATCPDCLREIFNPSDRRCGYPFTNCTNCGPRFSIIHSLPYDRVNTSMNRFTMCPQCQAEYVDPQNRRFHAQPNACPVCGPHLEFWDAHGQSLAQSSGDALERAAEALRQGQIVAVKGIGGFHLMAQATDEAAVTRLRRLKHREEKPFAVMFPSLSSVRQHCEVSPLESRALCSAEAPIVLLRRHPAPSVDSGRRLSPSIAPGNPYCGAMLPYAPLHHLFLARLSSPVVATSGNLSDEPICIDEHEALQRLHGIADLFLVHNRPIVRHVDDSIVRIMLDRELVLRRARGFAPLPIALSAGRLADRPILAVGAHLKNNVALAVGPQVFISQHIGDLETDQAFEAFRRVIEDFQNLYEARPSLIVADAHPDYLSTKYAQSLAASAREPGSIAPRRLNVQHHQAHVLSCLAENSLEPPVLGVSWDGTGYGFDGTVWGGEFFLVTEHGCERAAFLRPFRLPGSEQAVKEPRRTALGLLYAAFGEAAFAMDMLASLKAFSTAELNPLKTMLARGLNSPLTSSVGRLFDAVASLTGVRQRVGFEGQAAMELEFALEGIAEEEPYLFSLAPQPLASPSTSGERPSAKSSPSDGSALAPSAGSPLIVEWAPAVNSLLFDLANGATPGQISARFHRGLAESIVTVARRIGQSRVVLSGGCFQNRYLTERTVRRLREEGFHPYWHQRVPPNDGGISLGQIVAALRQSV